ncbi:hydrogenase expression protein HypF [Streptomyces rhizosphaericus]|uniref:Hydrogenase expression protein HypF n=1 Tax=Streptomyces rhizosphaericus TaxID=114699 RepID=A0A6G4ANX5_9ACTN|nr:hydrogenase expression protein HypF [Streptomyces rhizosphaericus]NEW74938.1 hydrogenase expression protein HypF [Streptomyces rhizosphaericus]
MGGTVRGEDRPEQPEGVSPRRVRTGPRHAAPKKSVLTRLQVPAGKAIALAAMPTAVLMGMGLTPQLASANPRPEDRYKPGPCVSQPDEADKDAKGGKDASDAQGEDKDAKDSKGSSDKGSQDGSKGSEESSGGQTGSRDDKATPTPSPSRSSSAPSSGSEDEQESKEPSASPSPSKSKNPLDPLGLGDTLHDVLTPDDKSGDESAEASASPSPSSSDKPSSSPSPSPSKSSDKLTDPVKDTVDKVGKGVKDTVDGVGKTVDDAKDTADKALPKPSASASKDADGKEAFPCPKFDADAYENAETDPTSSLLPEDPWTLKSTMLSLHGLDYKGIVEVKTQGGQVKKVLKFTASGVDIKDLHQLVVGPAGTTTHVQAREGSTSTIRNGTVTMYTEELKGNLLGLIPITFSSKSPPPVNIPEVFFTDVTVTQAGQFGGDLTVPGMHLFKTGE